MNLRVEELMIDFGSRTGERGGGAEGGKERERERASERASKILRQSAPTRTQESREQD